MDLERIKQNLRLRSGRSRKPRKAGKAPKDSESIEKPAKVEETLSKPVEEKSEPVENDTEDPVNGHVNGQVDGNGTKSEEQEERRQVEEQEVVQEKNPADSETKEETQDGDQADPSASGAAPTESKTDSENATDETIEEEMAPVEDNVPSTKDQDEEEIQDTKPDEEELYSRENNSSSDSLDFDLNPPSFKPKPPSIEQMSELLFSAGHFTTLLHHPALLTHFSTFLHRYRPKDYPILIRYIEASKAIAAIEYASAIAEAVPRLPDETEQPQAAVSVAESFQNLCSAAFDTLVNTTLPMYITYNLVKVVSECLTSEITGRASPMMKELVAGLSEIFCLTDPNREDNPIIYASEEFYRLTGYGRDDVIGHNCRFLQGPKTKREGPARLRECLDKGEGTCETLLNYRRDGRPFINLLMIAPLHDDKGNVKYNIGAQVDVSGLIAGGRTLDGFQRYLQQRKRDEQLEHEREQGEQKEEAEEAQLKRKALIKLRELSELFDVEESAVVQSHSRSSSMTREDDSKSIGSSKIRKTRKMLFDTDASDEDEEEENTPNDAKNWALGQSGPQGLSGKLPGIYEKYMLIRAAPSLRIVFVSPKLQGYGNIVQSPFMSHIAAPKSTLDGLGQSFKNGNPVSARVNFMKERGEKREGTRVEPAARHEHGKYGRACWIAATPLLGGDDQIGVWMIVFVEKTQGMNQTRGRQDPMQNSSTQQMNEEKSEKPKGIESPKIKDGEKANLKNQALTPQHRQNGTMPVKSETTKSPPEQDAMLPYRHIVAPPVEEYQSEVEEYEDAPAPQTPTYGISGDEYVQPRTPHRSTASPNRVRISPDSDEEEDEHEDGFDSNNDDESSHQEQAISPAFSQSPTSVDAPSSDKFVETQLPRDLTGVVTPERVHSQQPTSSTQRSRDMSPRYSSPDDSAISMPGRDKHDSVRSSVGYVDLIRLPGTSSPADYEPRGRGRFRVKMDAENDGYSDPDCEGSPYSVD